MMDYQGFWLGFVPLFGVLPFCSFARDCWAPVIKPAYPARARGRIIS